MQCLAAILRPYGSARAATIVALLWLSLFLLLTAAMILVSGGTFSYTIDDIYIGLSLAENILDGGYGINREEFSSPSSSLIYPMLLVPLLALGAGAYSALIVNFLVTLASVWLLSEFFFDLAGEAATRKVYSYVICFLMVLCINAFALPLTGMEHTLHVLLVIVVFRGFLTMDRTGRAPVSLMLAVILMPFVRFEGLALSVAALFVMLAFGQLRRALVCASAIVLGFAAWFAFTAHLGLTFFPSSVLSKQLFLANAIDRDAGAFTRAVEALIWHISGSFQYPIGIIFWIAIIVLFSRLLSSPTPLWSSKSFQDLMALTLIFTLGAHILFGMFGLFFRYEVYAVAILLCGGAIIYRDDLARICASGGLDQRLRLAAGLAILGTPYLVAAAETPRASRNIAEQQFQMHRFATGYFPRRVAVNDIGWVSFDNPNFVLDLVGLASEPVRNARLSRTFNSEFIKNLGDEDQIAFAMIYDSWFPGVVPADWCLMAVLKTEAVVTDTGDVSFYALRPSVIKDMSEALDRFAVTLPARVTLMRPLLPCSR